MWAGVICVVALVLYGKISLRAYLMTKQPKITAGITDDLLVWKSSPVVMYIQEQQEKNIRQGT